MNHDQISDYIVFMVAICALIYFIPAVIAFLRGHTYKWVILLLNVIAAWTGILWIVLLVWAIWPKQKLVLHHVIVDNPVR